MAAKDRDLTLDVVRGVAILLAAGWHFNQPETSGFAQILLWPGHTFGWAGVDLFFVLSGFLIGGLVFAEIDRTGTFQRSRFFIRRAMRLWPVLYMFVGAQFLLNRFPASSFVPQIVLHVQNYFPTPISHLWSLAIEEQFYLAVGLLLPLIVRRGGQTHLIIAGLVGIIILVTILRTAGSFAGLHTYVLQYQTQYRADELSLGVLLAVLRLHRPALFERLRRLWPLWLLVLAAMIGVLAFVRTDVALLRPLVGFPAAMCASGALLLLIYGRPIPRLALPLAKALAWFGVYSYSLYVWHPGIGRIGGAKLAQWTGFDSVETRIFFAYIAAIVWAYLVTKLVERPFLALRDRLFPTARARTPAERRVDAQEGAPRASV